MSGAVHADGPLPPTAAEQWRSVCDTVGLKLWFVWHWLRRHPGEEVPFVLRQRVDIFRKTACYDPATMSGDQPLFDQPRWLELEAAAARLYAEHRADASADAFERRAVELFRPALEEGRKAQAARPPPDFSAYQAGSLRYNPIPGTPGTVALHIGNALRPRSIFDDPDYLPRCLLALLDHAEAALGARAVHCGTWLNSHPRWLALFPDEWRRAMSPPDESIQWHLGFWGQFINARGLFHEKNGRLFRETGVLPFAHRMSDCSFAALRRHLLTRVG